MKRILKKLRKNKDGQAMTEYILIIVLIVVVCVVVARLFGNGIRELFIKAAREIKQ